MVLAIALPVRGDVARVAHREHVHVGRATEDVDDLECRGLLPLDTRRIDRVDQLDLGELRGGLAREFETVVEVALHLDDLGAAHDRLGELAHRDLSFGNQDGAGDTGAGGVGSRRRRRIARRRAQDCGLAVVDRVAHGHGHAAVLERARRVEALDLEVHLTAGQLRQVWRRYQRGRTLEEGHDLPVVADGQS